MRTSSRGEVDPFIVMDVMEAARAEEARGRSVIHMEVGQPGTPAPAAARAALAAAMEAGPLGYTVALGLPALRARIARLYRDWYGVDLDPARVVVTAGSSAAFILAFTSLFDARRPGGDRRAGLSELSQHPASALDLVPVGHPDRGPRTASSRRRRRWPTGSPGCWSRARPIRPARCSTAPALAALIGRRAERGIAFVSDEIYHGIQYGAARRLGAGDRRRGLRDQLVLEVLLDDRLAGRLDGGAGGACAPGRAAGAEPLHLRRRTRARSRRWRRSTRPTSSRRTSRSTAPTGRCCSRGCRGPGSAASRRRTAPSTSTPTCRDRDRRQPRARARGSCARPAWRSRRASTSTRGAAARTLRFSYAGATADIAEGLRRLAAWARG